MGRCYRLRIADRARVGRSDSRRVGPRAWLAVGLLALLGAASRAPGALSASGRADVAHWRLKPGGIGPLRLGMSAAKARRIVPGLRVRRSRFCESWVVPGLRDVVAMGATRSRGGLSFISISGYTEKPSRGHGARGVEIGDSIHELKRRFGKRLRFVKRIGALNSAFYRVYPRRHRRTALEVTVDTRTHRVQFEQVGFRGEFYYTDGVELCA